MNTLQKIYRIWSILPPWIKGAIFVGLIAIPTLNSLPWTFFKFGMQEADCISDFYLKSAKLKTETPEQTQDETLKAASKYSECLDNVSVNKGTVDFVIPRKTVLIKVNNEY